MEKENKKERKIKAEALKFLKERAEMKNDGFPMCYIEDGVEFHCNVCKKFWRERKKSHEKLEVSPF